ncbi:MAG: rRNA large subunit methyltransferase I, partial [Nitrospirae bacterium]
MSPKTVRTKSLKRLSTGHLWIFKSELLSSTEGLNPGDLVYVAGPKGDFIGTGYINPSNTLAIRLLSNKKIPSIKKFFQQSLERAINYRKTLYQELTTCRLVFSEGDLLPGLIVDKYEDVLVLQILTAGMERQKRTIIETLKELLEPKCIVLRNDSPFRLTEGLPQEKAIVHGKLPEKLLTKEGD